MATYLTSNTISSTVSSFELLGKIYQYGSFGSYPDLSSKTLAISTGANINLYSGWSNGYDGYGFQGSMDAVLDDDTPTIDYFIADQSFNNTLTIYGFQSTYLYNNTTTAIDTTRITGGMYRGSARWDGSGTLTVTGLQRAGGYSGSNWASTQTADGVGQAFCFINISNQLYLRQRKANLTHSTTYDTYSSFQFIGTSTFIQYAFNNDIDTLLGTHLIGAGQGFYS